MKIAITGAAGGLGVHVCRALFEAGHTVRGIDQVMRRDLPVPIEVANLLDREHCYRLFDGSEVIVHLANHSNDRLRDKQRLLSENLTMNTNVFQAALELGVKKIVFASSIQALGAGEKAGEGRLPTLPYLPIDGDTPARPTNSYGVSKQLSEEMLRYYSREAGMSCIALRFPFLARHQPQPGRARRENGTQHINEAGSYLSMPDAAALIMAVVQSQLPGFRVYIPAARNNRFCLTIPEVIERYFAEIPLNRPLEEIDNLFDISRITQETGWEPHDEWSFEV